MKKIVTIVLILAAIPIYTWNAWLLLGGLGSKGDTSIRTSNGSVLTSVALRPATAVHFIPKGKSPFTPNKEPPALSVSTTVKKTGPVKPPPPPKVQVAPPAITISGIMWNPQNPVAMINLPDGSSAMVKLGQQLPGGILMKAIEKNRIQVTSQGVDFWIAK